MAILAFTASGAYPVISWVFAGPMARLMDKAQLVNKLKYIEQATE